MGWWLGTQPPAMPSVDGMRPARLMDGCRERPSKCTAVSAPSVEMLSSSSCVSCPGSVYHALSYRGIQGVRKQVLLINNCIDMRAADPRTLGSVSS